MSFQRCHLTKVDEECIMTEHRTQAIDIDPRVNDTTQDKYNQQKRAEKRLWVHSDNSFTFNFFPEGALSTKRETSALVDVRHQFARPQTKTSTASPEPGSGFVFNFQIPFSSPEEMEKESGKPLPSEVLALKESKVEKPQSQNTQVIHTTVPTPCAEVKKKKKTGHKKKVSEEKQKLMSNLTDIEGACVEDSKVLTPEQQLKRELDWCIEQLELGMMTQKATSKQKEDASRAIKTLRSSKAPLAKKRQVMRAMSGDYRMKMEEEKGKQFKLIQAAMTSAQVKAVTDSSKRSVFHRIVENKTDAVRLNLDTVIPQENLLAQTPNTNVLGQDSTFVFIPTKEEFCFNFF